MRQVTLYCNFVKLMTINFHQTKFMPSFHLLKKQQRESEKRAAARARASIIPKSPSVPKGLFGPILRRPGPHPTLEDLIKIYVVKPQSAPVDPDRISDRQFRALLRKASQPILPDRIRRGIQRLVYTWGGRSLPTPPPDSSRAHLLRTLF